MRGTTYGLRGTTCALRRTTCAVCAGPDEPRVCGTTKGGTPAGVPPVRLPGFRALEPLRRGGVAAAGSGLPPRDQGLGEVDAWADADPDGLPDADFDGFEPAGAPGLEDVLGEAVVDADGDPEAGRDGMLLGPHAEK